MLFVDDEASNRKAYKMFFEDNLTPNVDLAEEYTSAIEKIKKTNYNLIVLDSLEGDCFRIIKDMASIPHGDIVIFSLNEKIKEQAANLGIPFYYKSDRNKLIKDYAEKYK